MSPKTTPSAATESVAMRACLDANVKLVTTQLDHELILTEVIIKLLRET